MEKYANRPQSTHGRGRFAEDLPKVRPKLRRFRVPSTDFGKLCTHNAQEVLGTDAWERVQTACITHSSAQTALARQGVAQCKCSASVNANEVWRSRGEQSQATLAVRTARLVRRIPCRQSRRIMHALTACASGPPLPEPKAKRGHGHAITRSKCDVFASSLTPERRDAREGSYASEAPTARGRQCFERMTGGIIGGLRSLCQVESFWEVTIPLWNVGKVKMQGAEKNYKKYMDSASQKGWLTAKRNVCYTIARGHGE